MTYRVVMYRRCRPLAFLALACCLVAGACSSDKGAGIPIGASASTAPGAASSKSVVPENSSEVADADSQPPVAGGDGDCAALNENIGKMAINWQVVIGLSRTPTSEWSQIPIGSLGEFGGQLDALAVALSSDADASSALAFMTGADDIVQRGIGGDTAAQADLAAYMGEDITASISKQIPIALALDSIGCR